MNNKFGICHFQPMTNGVAVRCVFSPRHAIEFPKGDRNILCPFCSSCTLRPPPLARFLWLNIARSNGKLLLPFNCRRRWIRIVQWQRGAEATSTSQIDPSTSTCKTNTMKMGAQQMHSTNPIERRTNEKRFVFVGVFFGISRN